MKIKTILWLQRVLRDSRVTRYGINEMLSTRQTVEESVLKLSEIIGEKRKIFCVNVD
jgi:hypothetical protein